MRWGVGYGVWGWGGGLVGHLEVPALVCLIDHGLLRLYMICLAG